MTITPQQLIALLPLLIVGLTVVVVMLSIAWRRNHFLNATLSVLGLNAALISLWFVGQNGAMDVTPLIRVDGYAMLYTGLVLLASLGLGAARIGPDAAAGEGWTARVFLGDLLGESSPVPTYIPLTGAELPRHRSPPGQSRPAVSCAGRRPTGPAPRTPG